jgi:hypothetical protein
MGGKKSKPVDIDWNIAPDNNYNLDNNITVYGENKLGAEYFTDMNINTKKHIIAFFISYILIILLLYKYLFLFK